MINSCHVSTSAGELGGTCVAPCDEKGAWNMRRTFGGGSYRWLVSAILGCMLALGLCPTVGIAEEVELGEQKLVHKHGDVEFDPWDSATSLPSEDSYYLTKDVTLNAPWQVNFEVSLCLNNHSIICAKDESSVIEINDNGTLNLYDEPDSEATITHAESKVGPGVLVDGGTFNMYGGTVSGNLEKPFSGGGVTVARGTFNMYDGTIEQNAAPSAGGVYVDALGTFNMHGGTIRDNSAEMGGGIGVAGNLNMDGGSVLGNAAVLGGGIVCEPDDPQEGITPIVALFGDACVMGNLSVLSQQAAEGQSSVAGANLCVPSGTKIRVNEALNKPDKPQIGVTIYDGVKMLPQSLEAAAEPDLSSFILGGTFTTGYASNMQNADPADFFFSDSDQYVVALDAQGEAQLAIPYSVKVAEDIQNGTVTVDKETACEGEVVNVTATPADGYELDVVTVDEKPIEGTSFKMLAKNVVVSATFKKKSEPTPIEVPPVSVTAHVQKKGTLESVAGGAIAGTTGKSLRLESLKLTVPGASETGGIEYRSHIQKTGWEKSYVRDGKRSGTEGKARRLEAVKIRLWGDMADKYDVYYRVHSQRLGWMAWAKNGESAGTQGMSRRGEAIQVVLVAKGAPAPATDFQGATQTYAKAFVKK